MQESILSELVAELKEKDSVLTKIRDGILEPVYFSSPFETLTEEPLEVRGVLLTEGIWNDAYYPKEVIEKLGEYLKEKSIPIFVEHGRTKEFGQKSVGVPVAVEYNETIKGLLGRILVTDPQAKELVKNRILKGFSLKGWVEKLTEDSKTIVTEFNPIEISLVKNPACEISWIAFSKEILDSLKKDKTSKEVVPMAEVESLKGIKFKEPSPGVQESEAVLELKEGEVIVLTVEPEEEAKKKQVPYYYGYPGKYAVKYPYYYPYYYPGYYGYPGYGYPYPAPEKKEKKTRSLEDLDEVVSQLEAKVKELEERINKLSQEEPSQVKEEPKQEVAMTAEAPQPAPQPVSQPSPEPAPEPEKNLEEELRKLSPAHLLILEAKKKERTV